MWRRTSAQGVQHRVRLADLSFLSVGLRVTDAVAPPWELALALARPAGGGELRLRRRRAGAGGARRPALGRGGSADPGGACRDRVPTDGTGACRSPRACADPR